MKTMKNRNMSQFILKIKEIQKIFKMMDIA